MKVNHVDSNTALTFQWKCIQSNQSGERKSKSNYAGSNSSSSLDFPRNRFYHAVCSVGKFVYIFGGKDRYSPLRDMWRLDTVTQKWKEMEDARSKIPHLQGHTMLAYKSQLLIFGGTFSETTEDIPLWIYSTDLNHVHTFSCESFTVRPTSRREHSAVIHKASMYIYGGFLDSSGSTDEFWAFNIEEEEWRLIRRHKPGKRHGHVAVVANSKMWIHGGMKGLTALSDLWAFSFGTYLWIKVSTFGAPPTLSNHTAHVVNGYLILFGGSKNGGLSQDIWMFRFDTLTWKQSSSQIGDPCPPITLHASVLLSAAVVQNVNTDRTQSVPVLKAKPIVCSEMNSVRPWTSPAVNPIDNQLNTANASTSSNVDILYLDAFGKDLDDNNNSDEDILNVSECKLPQTETSFSSPDYVHISQHQPVAKQHLKSFRASKNSVETSFCSEDNIAQNSFLKKLHFQTCRPSNNSFQTSFCSVEQIESSHNSSIAKQHLQNCTCTKDSLPGHIRFSSQREKSAVSHSDETRPRSISADNCGEAIPLLSRFYSIASDADLGESNLTITLSDEEICDPVMSKHNSYAAEIELHKENIPANLKRYSHNNSVADFGGGISGLYLNSLLSEKGFVTKDELLESIAMFRKERNHELLNSDLSHRKDYVQIKQHTPSFDSTFEKMSTFKSNVKNVVVSTCQNNEQELDCFSKNIYDPRRTSSFVNYCSNGHKQIAGDNGSIHPYLHSVSDLIIEDLESSNISEFFHNIKISNPKRPYLRSSSLKDVYNSINYPDDYTESNIDTCCLTKSQMTKSCDSFALWQKYKFHDRNVEYQKCLSETTKESSYLEKQFMKERSFSQNETGSGRYLKSVTSNALKNSLHHPGIQNNQEKLSLCGKTSIGTQTADSQTLQPSSKPHSQIDKSLKFDHFVTTTAVKTDLQSHGRDTDSQKHESITNSHETIISADKQPEPVATKGILLGTEICILVIGGQTESPSFQTEPIKLWQCCI